jgi:hypothetical protein
LASYLVIHTPIVDEEGAAQKPSDLLGLARAATEPRADPRWIKTWSPDLNDDRLFTFWEADNSAEIVAVLQRFGFLDNMTAQPIRVREWGPVDVLASQAEHLAE